MPSKQKTRPVRDERFSGVTCLPTSGPIRVSEYVMVEQNGHEIVVKKEPAPGLKVLNSDLVDIIDAFLDQVKRYHFGTVTITMEKDCVTKMAWAPSIKLKTTTTS